MPDTTPASDDVAGGAPPQEPPSMRASDADRHATVHVLQDAVARGLLTTDEGGERMAVAYAARHLDDLPPLTADLPPAPGATEAPAPPGGGRSRRRRGPRPARASPRSPPTACARPGP